MLVSALFSRLTGLLLGGSAGHWSAIYMGSDKMGGAEGGQHGPIGV